MIPVPPRMRHPAGSSLSGEFSRVYLSRLRRGGETIVDDYWCRGTDSSRYTGSINYVSFSQNDEDYWRIPIESIEVVGSAVDGVVSNLSVEGFGFSS